MSYRRKSKDRVREDWIKKEMKLPWFMSAQKCPMRVDTFYEAEDLRNS